MLNKLDFAVDYSDNWRNNYKKRASDDPIKDLSRNLKGWRKESVDLHDNNVLIEAATQNFANIVIGSGINIAPKPILGDEQLEKELAYQIKILWEDWANSCHIDGQQDLASLSRSLVAAIIRDADALVYITLNSRGKIVLDIIDSSRIDTPNPEQMKKYIARLKGEIADIEKASKKEPKDYAKISYNNKLIREFEGKDSVNQLGVQLNRREIVGYIVKNDIEKDGFSYFPAFTDQDTISSVLLRNPSNTFRLNSYRGKPLLTSCVGTIQKLEQLMNSELKAAILKTLQIGKYTAKDPKSAKGNSLTFQKVEDAHIFFIPAGDTLDMSSGSDISNKELPATAKLYLQQIASSYNIPYNVLYNCLEDSSYSTNSSIFLAAWQNTEIWRNHLIRNLLKPVYELLLQTWYSEGLLTIGKFNKKTANVEFHGKPNIPIKAKDIYEASATAIATGQNSRINLITAMGLDPYSIIDDEAKLDAYKKLKREELGLNDIEEGKLDNLAA